MSRGVSLFVGSVLMAGISLAVTPAMGVEPDAEMRSAARMVPMLLDFAGAERPLEKRDLNGYCTVLYGGPEYVGYLTSICELAIKKDVIDAAACTAEKIRQDVRKSLETCVAMPPEQLEKAIQGWRSLREKFVSDTKTRGVDGEKLLQEEQAKLR